VRRLSSTAGDSHDDALLAKEIRSSSGSDKVISTTLKTDERVIARVTDGIYRQPGSALRELISNAYDADATRVIIKTDAPRFDKISIEDNGHGMTPEALAHLLLHIGGSPKRTRIGKSLGVTSSKDPTKSPGGRKLIGKIGIGLFSVSQLTHTFQIITKVSGDNRRTIATVALKQFSDDQIEASGGKKSQFETGKVNIWRERAADTSASGTTIVLTSIRPQARDTLRSRDIWAAIEQSENAADDEDRQTIEPPQFHIGRVDGSGQLLVKSTAQHLAIPWEQGDKPADAFRKLVDCVWQEVEGANTKPQLDRIFDYYLRMIWQLSLAVPLKYVDGHLFDKPAKGWARVFSLSNESRGAATEVGLRRGTASIRDVLDLHDPVEATGKFDVFVDDLKLLRPIKYRDLPKTTHAIKQPLVFVGKCHETFGKVPRELSGGPLAFEAYLFWTPKVAPTEHQGSLIRIHGSSGTLFDPTFMRYQVSELTRLRQITCEIFVSEGLEGALNIDRESFNTAHPHAVYITKWLYSALRQVATVQKRVGSETRQHLRDTKKEHAFSRIQHVADRAWEEEVRDQASSPPAIEFSDERKKALPGETYVYSRNAVLTKPEAGIRARAQAKNAILEEKLKAIAQVLASFGLLDSVSRRRQERLLRAIYEILEAPDE
jgi:hypothetical protein